MKLKFDGFFGKKNDFCVNMPKINTGSININHGECFDKPSISVTVPHITTDNEAVSKLIAKEHTYTFKL
ncbi:hypothetical protein OQJ26_14190 [Legionella sp. PATHC038]|uniref:hypothetical protein n=1 Tax=Legionella sheltonii TaxID=2992041 RepID=UPI002244C204|nr:hypothetical protein [Legionella sp. PATHC038]MCW8399936.1 hypothetical protein [Legionella sp. PATHC038]